VSRVYGEKLLYIECDGCGARLRPAHDVIDSGWVREGFDSGPGTEKHERVYCVQCSYNRERR
jgi:hypothetical protein